MENTIASNSASINDYSVSVSVTAEQNEILHRPTSPPRSSPQLNEIPAALRRGTLDKNLNEFRRSKTGTPELPHLDHRLVVASNRVIDPGRPAAGGLAVALGDMMRESEGLWFGWSGKTTDRQDMARVQTESFGRTTLVQFDLSKKHHDGYYAGFANSALWPVFHDKVKLAEFDEDNFKDYESVNKIFASELARTIREDDILWIHDYHLIPLAQELRSLGCKQNIGFFSHIPFPSPEVIKHIPQHRKLIESLMSYDLVGMQCPKDVENLQRYVETEGIGHRLDDRNLEALGRKVRIQSFPIGIHVESLNTVEPNKTLDAIVGIVRNESNQRMVMVGVDRLDYTKGVPRRLKAFHELLDTYPNLLNQITLVQIAAPTRQGILPYARLSDKTRALVDRINGQFGTANWKPVMYFNQSVDHDSLPEIYRMSRVGVVTPLADGMNLVAKEYIAAQKPDDPGVLVLSTGAGAASQLDHSLSVPPKDRSAIAKACARALSMPLEERQWRYKKLMDNVNTEDLRWWRETYLNALTSSFKKNS
ncbi:Alpha,alpha-trehalose-phosphate synthase (UDP-forming) [Paraburkholderia ribeironis]|uniref:Alpha,alpha-trehalose-phosphate synthase (UDP-forming) n=1 Tax=Paraburkholderia ribeironis TaxID=1247936 RepID=A0A1N7SKX5_9BURK|nr:trehalose-6-phosphate synthase [Paraburkholderia ribeironis]SIT48038.1 Alpha,alpha-trehalose-phosphate synthase (UDP-forming) [Paraburkholderia ribeironis]